MALMDTESTDVKDTSEILHQRSINDGALYGLSLINGD